jgi:hypothetical protein
LHNRHAARFISSALDARSWSVTKLAAEIGTKRSVLSAQLSGARRIQLSHLMKYMRPLTHKERPRLLAAWLRDYIIDPDLVTDLLEATGDGVALDVREFVPGIDQDTKMLLAWWAREMARDCELHDLFKLLSAKAGYHPKRTAAGPAKRRRRDGVLRADIRGHIAPAHCALPKARESERGDEKPANMAKPTC